MTRPSFAAGDAVQTALGKGRVREVRNGGQLLVEIGGRAVVFSPAVVRPLDSSNARRSRADRSQAASPPGPSGDAPVMDLDLHGLTVPEALARVERVVNDALLAGSGQLRIIHGRSGGRVRQAVHTRLRQWSSVRGFRLDPSNPGVTIVDL